MIYYKAKNGKVLEVKGYYLSSSSVVAKDIPPGIYFTEDSILYPEIIALREIKMKRNPRVD